MGVKLIRDGELLAWSPRAVIAIGPKEEALGIWIPMLTICASTVREIVAMHTTLFKKFNGATLYGAKGLDAISMVWGDFMMYETGEPTIRDFYAVPGKIEGVFDPAVVSLALKRLQELREGAWKQQ